MKRMRSGGGWAAVLYTLRMAHRVGWRQLWKAMRTKNACKTCALGMGGQAGGMRNEAGHWPEVCKKSLQAMVADMQKGLKPEFFERVLARPAADAVAARAGMVRPPHHAALRRPRRHALSRPSAGMRRSIASPANCVKPAPDENFFYASGRSSNEAGFLLQLFARAVRHQLRQQLLLLLPSGQRRRPERLGRHRHGDRHARRCRKRRSVLPHRRQSRVEPSAADAHADEHPPPRRPRHRHQSGQGTRPGQFQRAVRCAQPAVRLEDRQPVRAAAHRRRHRAADRHGQARARTRRRRPHVHRASDRRLRRVRSHRRRRLSWDEIETGSGVDRQRPSSRSPTSIARRRTPCSAGRWASRITSTASPTCRAIVNLALLRGMVGRPQRGLDADSRALQRAGHRLDGRRAEAQAEDPRQPGNAT